MDYEFDKPEVKPVPDVPEYKRPEDVYRGVESASPDLIVFADDTLPVDIMSELLFENLGGQELISLVRNDILNGQDVRYQIIANLGLLNQEYNPRNIFKVPGVLSDYFENFAIKISDKVPENGTGPAPYYVGAAGTSGCTDPALPYPVLDRYDDTLIGCYPTLSAAQEAIRKELAPFRDIVYSDPENGNIVVDVVGMGNNEQVDIEILASSTVEDDTIY